MFDLPTFIKATGYIGIAGIVFAESGLLIGFFLPGDSLLFTAGFLASQDYLNIWLLIPLAFVAAVLGDNAGYAFGKRLGPRIFRKPNSLLFNKEHIQRSEALYERNGGKALILARFIPVVRTFAPILAGVGSMRYRTFFLFNILGGLVWTVGVTILGYFLGRSIPNVDHYILPIIGLIIVLSILPSAIHLLKDKKQRKRLLQTIKNPAQD